MKPKKDNPPVTARGGAGFAAGAGAGVFSQISLGVNQSAKGAAEKDTPKHRDPDLLPYLGTHVLRGDVYLETSNAVNTSIQLNAWLGYHQDVQVIHNSLNWLGSVAGTPRYYRTLYTSQYSPTHSACVRKIVATTIGNGLEFKTKKMSEKSKRYAAEIEAVLSRALYSLLVCGDSYVYQSTEGYLDFWGLDVVRINTAGGQNAVKAGILKRTLQYNTIAEPDFPTSIYPRTDKAENNNGYTTVYRVMNKNSTRAPFPEPERLAAELPARSEYTVYTVGDMHFKRGVPPRFIVGVKGETYTSPGFKALSELIQQQSSGLAANTSILTIPVEDSGNGGGDKLDVAVLNNPDIPAYIDQKKELRETIVGLMGLTPFLAGFSTPGSLGSTKERNAEYVNFIENTVKPLRRQLEKDLILPYFAYCDAFLDTRLSDDYIGFIQNNSLNLIEAIDAAKVLSVNESRAILGYAPIDDDDANIPIMILETRQIRANLEASVTPSGATDDSTADATNTGM